MSLLCKRYDGVSASRFVLLPVGIARRIDEDIVKEDGEVGGEEGVEPCLGVARLGAARLLAKVVVTCADEAAVNVELGDDGTTSPP